jgi:hypothetical protein
MNADTSSPVGFDTNHYVPAVLLLIFVLDIDT